jgi:CTP-dependent riboflavin kinase
MLINITTYVAAAEATDERLSAYFEEGTVEVTIRNETRRVRALRAHSDGAITAYGTSGRYVSGAKAWPATITNRPGKDGTRWESVSFGRDDRSGRFNKANLIFFAD